MSSRLTPTQPATLATSPLLVEAMWAEPARRRRQLVARAVRQGLLRGDDDLCTAAFPAELWPAELAATQAVLEAAWPADDDRRTSTVAGRAITNGPGWPLAGPADELALIAGTPGAADREWLTACAVHWETMAVAALHATHREVRAMAARRPFTPLEVAVAFINDPSTAWDDRVRVIGPARYASVELAVAVRDAEHPAVRAAAFDALAQRPCRAFQPWFAAAATGDPDRHVRDAALRGLDVRILTRLGTGPGHPDPARRIEACFALAARGVAHVVAHIATSDPDGEVRTAALGRFATGRLIPNPRRLRCAPFDQALAGAGATGRAAVPLALGASRTMCDHLARHHPERDVRAAALRHAHPRVVLAHLGNPDPLLALVAHACAPAEHRTQTALTSLDVARRLAAVSLHHAPLREARADATTASALRAHPTARLRHDTLARIALDDPDPAVREAALDELDHASHDPAVGPVRDQDAIDRALAAPHIESWIRANLADLASVTALNHTLAHDPDPHVRCAAARAGIRRPGPWTGCDETELMAAWFNPDTRTAAAEALAELRRR